ncbi:MAG TPA: Ig-like domain-containing protein [Streptosporangiaceae bacterium]|nr:Ig-like domain-containing protein [Streptosporangiaceae bacterium]
MVEGIVLRMDNSSSRRTRLLPLAVVCAAGILATACQSTAGTSAGGTIGGAGGKGTSGAKHEPHSPKPASTGITISPANGASNVNPASGVTVTSSKGTIKSVTVSGDPVSPVTGHLNAARTTWHSDWTLPVDQTLTVKVTAAESSGHTVSQTSVFKTINPSRTFTTQIFEGYRQTYGVGMPIMLTFSHPITNQAAVERALVIRSSRPVTGAWYWDNSQTLAFRPRQYWPQDTTVSFTGHLNGVEGASGVYGMHTLTQTFYIGQSLIVVASTKTHRMKLYRGGKLYRNWPISSGRPGDNTPNGTYLTIEKGNPVLMKGPGYRIEVPWSVRFTWSGDYLHDAFWSVGEQGFTNVSHGCVNMAPADSKIYYKMAVPGDPVTIVGSPRHGVWDNGWTYWFDTWSQFLKGSALHKAVLAGPHGSTFVNPATLTDARGSAPVDQPWPKNSWASGA